MGGGEVPCWRSRSKESQLYGGVREINQQRRRKERDQPALGQKARALALQLEKVFMEEKSSKEKLGWHGLEKDSTTPAG